MKSKCRSCKKQSAPGYARCQHHLDYYNQKNKELTNRRREKRRKGLCYDCSKLVEPGKTRCAKHLTTNKQGVTRYLKSDKGFYYREKDTKARRARGKLTAQKYRRGKGRFKYVSAAAKRKGKEWNLSEEFYYLIIIEPCHYCGLDNDVEAGTGLDRLDNSRGYLLDNVVSCCTACNIARGDRFSIEEMKKIGQAIREVKLSRIIDKVVENAS